LRNEAHGEHNMDPPTAIGTELLPGESQQSYIFAIYDGDSDYLIRIGERKTQRILWLRWRGRM